MERPRYALFAVLPAIGHINPLLQQAKELRRRGWRVALATTDEMRAHVERTAPDVPFVGIGPVPADLMRRLVDETARSSAEPNFLRSLLRSAQLFIDGLWPLLFDGFVAAIGADRPDLMVVDVITIAGFDAADAERVPFLVNNPDLVTILPYTLLPPAHDVPTPFSGASIHSIGAWQKVLRRALQPLSVAILKLFYATLNQRLNACRRSRGLPPVEFGARLAERPVMTNGAFGLEYPRPLARSVHMVGPMLPDEIEPLPAAYQEWLDRGLPVVYVNLGTVALPPRAQLSRMLDGLQSDRIRVWWILKEEQHQLLPDALPPNVRVDAWGPPLRAVLSHPAVRVFVSHCGINSVHESLAAGTPIVGIPMVADQRDMAMRVQDAGAGLVLNKTRFTPAELRDAIQRVMHEPAFRESIPAIQASFRRAGGITKAADLIEAFAASPSG